MSGSFHNIHPLRGWELGRRLATGYTAGYLYLPTSWMCMLGDVLQTGYTGGYLNSPTS